MYGLKNAGKVSKDRLVKHLNSSDFFETKTPCLFRHATRDVTFCLVVDDFGIKYSKDEDLTFLVDCLSQLYHVKVHPVGTKYLGFTIEYSRSGRDRSISLSYPSYIPSLLKRIRPLGVKLASTPSIYTPPSYGRTGPQKATAPPPSPPASAAQAKELQVIVGSVLCYAIACDYSMLPAVCALSCQQSAPTLATMAAAERLLGYAAKFPRAYLVYYPSDMKLFIHSDASYLSRPNAKSVAGGVHYLVSNNPSLPIRNSPIHCFSSLIPVVVAAVSEAEFAAVFANGQVGSDERTILSSIGYPQSPTDIYTDNECAVGLSNSSVTPKMSKSIDMRFNWIRDRVRQLLFNVRFVSGSLNRADFMTKALPVHTHTSLVPYFISRSPPLVS